MLRCVENRIAMSMISCVIFITYKADEIVIFSHIGTCILDRILMVRLDEQLNEKAFRYLYIHIPYILKVCQHFFYQTKIENLSVQNMTII